MSRSYPTHNFIRSTEKGRRISRYLFVMHSNGKWKTIGIYHYCTKAFRIIDIARQKCENEILIKLHFCFNTKRKCKSYEYESSGKRSYVGRVGKR